MWRIEIHICPFLLLPLLGTIIEAKRKNLITEFVKESGSSIFGGNDNTEFAILIESKESEDYDDHLDEFQRAAEKFEDKVRFVYINSDVEENWQIIEFLGLIAEDVPGVLFVSLEKHFKKYKAEMKEIAKAEIISFVQSCLDGKAIPFLKSDEIPDDWNKKPVVELVGKNFEEQVFDSKKTTFVFFYVPWCEACQKMMPELQKLGELYKNKKDLIIAKMNSMNNEVFGLPVLDVPTIALFIKGSKKPIYHTEDERTANNFSKFITKNLKRNEENRSNKHEKENKKGKINDGKKQLKNKDKKQVTSKDEL
uniref:Thioredoxin domain-containing protein n=1 Tax=Elaeophora elaphi TaxID=1147741 RepID=A0A0R3S0W7_9BILA